MNIEDLIQGEMEEVYRINAIVPTLMIQQMIPLMKKVKVFHILLMFMLERRIISGK